MATKGDSWRAAAAGDRPEGQHGQRARVVVVGAGMAGLSAANHLVTNGMKDVLVLEAAHRYDCIVHVDMFEHFLQRPGCAKRYVSGKQVYGRGRFYPCCFLVGLLRL